MEHKQAQQIKWVAALAVALLGIPLGVAFTQAMIEGTRRHQETPLRALVSDAIFEDARAGKQTPVHYVPAADGPLYRAPDFEVVDAFGQPWRLADHRGKVIVLNFWMRSCQACVEEMPSLIELARILSDDERIMVVGLSTDKGWPVVADLFPPRMHMKVLFDPNSAVVKGLFGTQLYPETWIIDGDGIIRLRVDGKADWSSSVAIDAIKRAL